jgi:hypothetical protein
VENLKKRIEITETVIKDGTWNLPYGQKIIMDNQVAIMEALLECQQNMEILMIRTR